MKLISTVNLLVLTAAANVMIPADPVVLEQYYVMHSEGVHMITLPWLTPLRAFVNSECELL